MNSMQAQSGVCLGNVSSPRFAASKWCALGSFIEVGIRSGACSWSGSLREAGHRRTSGIAVKSVVSVLHILALHDGRLTQQPRRPSSTVGCPICSQL